MKLRSRTLWLIAIVAGLVAFNVVAFVFTAVYMDEKGIDLTPPPSPVAKQPLSLDDFLDGKMGILPPKAPKSAKGHDELFQMSEFDPELARFVGLEIGQSRVDANTIIFDYFSSESSESATDIAMQRRYLSSGLTQILVARTELADDSVKAEQLLAVFSPNDAETVQLVDYGMRVKCWRGENPEDWQTTLCP